MNYRQHRTKWIDCKRCSLCKQRNHVVLVRGKLPCDFLIIGEAPGRSEDCLGKPFIGPAGKLLDQLVAKAWDGQYDYAITNLVGCIPLDNDNSKIAEPPEEAIKACEVRLQELFAISRAAVWIRVGKLAEQYVGSSDTPSIDLLHPAAILRMDVSQQGLAIQRAIVALEGAADLLEELRDERAKRKKPKRPTADPL